MARVNDMPKTCGLHPCSRRKRSKRRRYMPSLPKEIIFKILLCLPANIIYNVMRYVCREWYNIIKDPIFIDAHHQESPAGFLVQVCPGQFSTLYVETGKHGIQITDLNVSSEGMRDGKGHNWFWPQSQFLQYGESDSSYLCKFVNFPGRVLSSCRGLVLVPDLKFLKCLHVANLLSKQWVKLPPMTVRTIRTYAGMAYAASCQKYKVACPSYSGRDCLCAILTLGVDKAWRCIAPSIDMSRIPPKVDKTDLFANIPYSVGGYIHWVFFSYVVSLAVETESFHVSVAPRERKYETREFLVTESSLSFMALCKKYTWELWSLREVETGDWIKLVKIDLTAQKPVLEKLFVSSSSRFDLIPLTLLKNGELVVFRVSGDYDKKRGELFVGSRNLVICNVRTGAIDSFEFVKQGLGGVVCCFPHVNSLVSL